MNLDIAPRRYLARVVMVAGLGLVFAPLNVAAYLYIPRSLRGPPWVFWPSCAMKAAASALPWARRSRSGANNSIHATR